MSSRRVPPMCHCLQAVAHYVPPAAHQISATTGRGFTITANPYSRGEGTFFPFN